MSCHVYPFTFEFKSRRSGKKETRTILIWTTRNRKKEWIIQSKDNWDDDWRTVVKVAEKFPEHVGKEHFFWQLMGWSLVETIRQNISCPIEDEISLMPEKYQKKLDEIPLPEPADRGQWHYLVLLEEALKPIGFKVLSHNF